MENKKSTQSQPIPSIKEMSIDLGFTEKYCKKIGKKSTYNKWVDLTKEKKREKLEKATAELISIGLPKEQSKAIADVKVNHPEVYDSLEAV